MPCHASIVLTIQGWELTQNRVVHCSNREDVLNLAAPLQNEALKAGQHCPSSITLCRQVHRCRWCLSLAGVFFGVIVTLGEPWAPSCVVCRQTTASLYLECALQRLPPHNNHLSWQMRQPLA